MAYDFDRMIDRRGTRSYKWDQLEKLFGSEDVLPLWVADMDFYSPPEAVEAINRRAEEGIYGYTIRTDSYLESITRWFARRHDWPIRPEWITDVPGVVPALAIAVETFTEPGGRVVLQPPVYYPFYDVIRLNGREIAANPLVIRDGKYEMDLEHLEQLFREGAKLLLLCNPHNPGGRVWTREELLSLGELCVRYGVTVVSDEIHCDLALPGHKHVPFASLSQEIADLTLTCLAPSKTFNMPGLALAFAVASNPALKRKFDGRVKALSLHMVNFFGTVATEACYESGEAWLEELVAYIQGNADFAVRYLEQHAPRLKPMRPEGTYLLWVDCRELGLDAKQLKELMHKRAKVAFNDGSTYGEEGEGWLRINLACPRARLEEALKRFAEAVQTITTP